MLYSLKYLLYIKKLSFYLTYRQTKDFFDCFSCWVQGNISWSHSHRWPEVERWWCPRRLSRCPQRPEPWRSIRQTQPRRKSEWLLLSPQPSSRQLLLDPTRILLLLKQYDVDMRYLRSAYTVPSIIELYLYKCEYWNVLKKILLLNFISENIEQGSRD